MKSKKKVKGRTIKKICMSILALVMLITVVISSLPEEAQQILAATKIVDENSSGSYMESLGNNDTTEWAGRIWTDKTVYSEDAVFTDENVTVKNDSDLLVSYSILATTQEIKGGVTSPADVVFVIDVSGSMTEEMGNDSGSRIRNTITALNSSIHTLMTKNENNRVGVVMFSGNDIEVLPLARWTTSNTTNNNGTTIYNYFTVSDDDDNTVSVRVRATSETNGISRKVNSVDVTGGTNIQKGIYAGMNMLANATDLVVNINGDTVKRSPSLVLLSDGAPTYSARTSDWWNPTTSNVQGPGGSSHYGNGMLAMMTGAYMKKVVDAKYGVADSSLATKIYTIGMGLDVLTDDDLNLARVTLNPEDYYNANNTMARSIRTAFATYAAGGSVDVEVNSRNSSGNNRLDSLKTRTVDHPNGTIDITSIEDYVDSYYDASSASSVNEVFSNIVDSITLNAAKAPTKISTADPFELGEGDVVYTDYIGQYMEVKDLKAIIYEGQKYEIKDVITEENITKYVFDGEVNNPVYGKHQLSEIIITVTVNDAGNQILEVRIPAGAVPLRVNTVELNSDNSVKSHTSNNAYPLRVLYTIGIDSDIINNGVIDTSKVSQEYIDANRNDDGSINFYSGMYTGNTVIIDGEEKTVGDSTVTFRPALDNPFYYVQEPIDIYLDKELTQKAPSNVPIQDGVTYYYKDVYYNGTDYVERAIARTGVQLKQVVVEDSNGYWVRTQGTPRKNRMFHFKGTKDNNYTNTASEFYTPTFENGQVVVYFGNNGLVSAMVGGTLAITKNVTADSGLTAPDKEFTFTVTLRDENNAPLSGTYRYNVVDAEGNTVNDDEGNAITGTVGNNGTITLKDGQTANIFDLPIGTTYEVIETAVDGFTSNVGATETNRAFGEIVGGEKRQVTFTNNYSAQAVTIPAATAFPGKKVLEGRQWANGDSFTFAITPAEGSPAPENLTVTVTDDDAQNGEAEFNFGAVTFDKPGQFTYLIVERAVAATDRLPGMTYSLATYEVNIVVKDNGEGELVVESNNMIQVQNDRGVEARAIAAEEAVFTNLYSPEEVKWAPLGTKNYTDNSGQKPLTDGMFTFAMKAVGDNASEAPMPDNLTADANGEVFVTNTENVFHFDQSTFTEDMIGETFTYQVREVIPEGATTADNGNTYTYKGMTYDGTIHTVTVSVTYQDPVLVVTPSYDQGDRIVFENTYTPDEVTLGDNTNEPIKGIKTLVGRDMNDGETFNFTLETANQTTSQAITDGVIILENAEASVEGGQNGEAVDFNFGKATFKKPGTYAFNVKELAGNSRGVTYDNHTCTVTVEVTDVDGELVADVDYSDGTQAEFVNTYQATFDNSTAINLNGKKNMTGEALIEGAYYFTVQPQNNAPMGGTLASNPNMAGSQNADGSYTGNITLLKNIVYTEAGTYTYIIRENIPANKRTGVTYDESVYEVTVVVTDDNNGYLKASTPVIMKQSGDEETEVQEIIFNNSYKPESTTILHAEMMKILEGNRNIALQANEFQFEMSIVSATSNDGIILPNPSVVGNAANGTIQFEEITFTEPGTYVLQVAEIIPTNENERVAGVTYDEHTVHATINVTDEEGRLHAVLARVTGSYEFRNVYNTEGELDGSDNLNVTKNFTGRSGDRWLSTDEFSFTLVPTGDTVKAVEDGLVILPDNAEGIKITANDTVKEKAFGNIKFKEPGDYTFEISEVKGTIDRVTYDEIAREVTVHAKDNGDGTMTVTAEVTEGENLVFTNTYTPQPVTATLGGTKKMLGRELLETDKFGFTISKASDSPADTPMPAVTTVENDEFGNITFEPITYTKEGTYNYIIRETSGSAPGVDNDQSEVRATVEVTQDTETDALVTNVTYAGEGFVFTNEYKAAPTDNVVGFTAKKVVNASDGNNYTLKGGEFEFTITPSANNPEGDPVNTKTVTNDSDGNVSLVLSEVVYDKPGEYVYTIKEVSDKQLAGMAYDSSVYTITVNVVDNQQIGKLEATLAIAKDGEAEKDIIFENNYNPTETSVNLAGKKVLEGKALETGEFKFKITADDEAPMPAEDTVSNVADEFQFGTITFTKPGNYNYTINEVNEGKNGYTYDDKVYNVEVAVSDVNGELKAEVTGNDNIVFENTYTVTPVTLKDDTALRGTKKLTGRALNEGEFTFQLLTPEGTLVSEVKNNADGSFVFESLTFETAGTYNYRIVETNNRLGGITYDTNRYDVEIQVEDKGGYLEATTKYLDQNEKAVDSVVFENSYAPQNANVQFRAIKKLVGRDLKAKEFTFVLKDEQGNVIATATNDEVGVILFEEMVFDKEGTYIYTITEEQGDAENITYDDTVYTVTVTVKDNLQGYLEATIDYEGKELVFNNSYDDGSEENPNENPKEDPTKDPGKGKINKGKTSPKTNDSTPIFIVMIIGILSLLSAVKISLICERERRYKNR